MPNECSVENCFSKEISEFSATCYFALKHMGIYFSLYKIKNKIFENIYITCFCTFLIENKWEVRQMGRNGEVWRGNRVLGFMNKINVSDTYLELTITDFCIHEPIGHAFRCGFLFMGY